MLKRSIELSDDLSAALESAVAAGQYHSIDAAITHAVKIWAKRETAKADSNEYMRSLIQEGVDSGPGRELDFEELKAEMRAEHVRRKDSRRVA
jgi:antitoxin ParD1/3/4